jgi:HK97 family phage major capsid protein
MKTQYQRLLAERGELRTEGTAIMEKAERNDEQGARLGEISARLEALNGEIEQEERTRALLLNAPAPAGNTIPAQVREPAEKFRSFGEQLQAVAAASTPGGAFDRRLAPFAATGMNEGIGSEGGFLVQQDLAAGILLPMVEQGEILRRCRPISISAGSNGVKLNAVDQSSRANGSRWGGVTAYWRAEAGTVTASKPKLRQVNLDLNSLMALYYATDELLADSAALQSVVVPAFTQELLYKAEDGVIRGTGVGQLKGVLADSNIYVQVSKETGQAADTVLFENIKKMWARRWQGSGANYVWFVNQDVEPQLYGMSMPVGTGGVPVYMPAGGISGAPYASLFNRPVIAIEQAATVGDLGDVMLLDLSQYLLADKGGVEQASSIHVMFIYAETTFRFMWRLDGQPAWNASVTPANGSNKLSPFIVLEAR